MTHDPSTHGPALVMNNYVFNLLYEEVEAPEAEGSSELRGLGDCDGSNQKPEKVAQQPFLKRARRVTAVCKESGLNKFLQEQEWRCHLVLMNQQPVLRKGTCSWDAAISGVHCLCHAYSFK